MSGASLIQLVVSGISIGAVYGLVGLGFVTIYRASGVVNFAQGEFVMLGAMMGFNLWKKVGINYPLSCLIAVVAVSIVGLLIYQLIVVPLRGAPPVMIIMGTIGVSVLLQNVALNLWTSYPVFGPSFSGNTPIRIGSIAIASQNLWILGMAIAVVVGLYFLNNKTRVGKAMTATATEPMAAGLVGVRTGSMIRLAFVIAAAIGALAGIFVSPVLPVSFLVGSTLTLKGFVASVLGGWGRPSGALVGGIALGVVETVTGGYVQAGYKDAVAFVLLLVVLSFRPGGLLGSSLTEAEA